MNTFDYNTLRKERTIPAIAETFSIIGTHAQDLAYDPDITKEEVMEIQTKVSQAIIDCLVKHNVHHSEMNYYLQSVQVAIMQILQKIVDHKNSVEEEFISRSLKAQNPGTGKFDRHYATLGNLFESLDILRKEQDVDGVDNYRYVVSEDELQAQEEKFNDTESPEANTETDSTTD